MRAPDTIEDVAVHLGERARVPMVGGRVPLLAGADAERLGLVSRIPAVVSRYVFGS